MLKPIPSNPAYLISDSGQIFSTKSKKYLKTPCGNVGCPLVNLTAGKGKRTTHTVHSLVALKRLLEVDLQTMKLIIRMARRITTMLIT